MRLDYGYSARETVEISRQFTVFLNASTITGKEILEWKNEGAELSRFVACHNFYPKPYTGLSGEKVKEINGWLKGFGLQTMAFVPGDGVLRGPLQEGLPTVEEHRFHKEDVLLHLLSLHYDLGCDTVAIGDIDVSDRVWKWNRDWLGITAILRRGSTMTGWMAAVICSVRWNPEDIRKRYRLKTVQREGKAVFVFPMKDI